MLVPMLEALFILGTGQVTERKAVFHIEPLVYINSSKSSATALAVCPKREDECICLIKCLKQYLKLTKQLRSSAKFFISTLSLHDSVTKYILATFF